MKRFVGAMWVAVALAFATTGSAASHQPSDQIADVAVGHYFWATDSTLEFRWDVPSTGDVNLTRHGLLVITYRNDKDPDNLRKPAWIQFRNPPPEPNPELGERDDSDSFGGNPKRLRKDRPADNIDVKRTQGAVIVKFYFLDKHKRRITCNAEPAIRTGPQVVVDGDNMIP